MHYTTHTGLYGGRTHNPEESVYKENWSDRSLTLKLKKTTNMPVVTTKHFKTTKFNTHLRTYSQIGFRYKLAIGLY